MHSRFIYKTHWSCPVAPPTSFESNANFTSWCLPVIQTTQELLPFYLQNQSSSQTQGVNQKHALSYPGKWTFYIKRSFAHQPQLVVKNASHTKKYKQISMKFEFISHTHKLNYWWESGTCTLWTNSSQTSICYRGDDETPKENRNSLEGWPLVGVWG